MVFRALIVVFEVLFWLLVVRLIGRWLAAAIAPARRRDAAPRAARPQVRAAEDLVLDRVCRTHVPLSSALKANVGGREEHFCSAACRDRALAELARAS